MKKIKSLKYLLGIGALSALAIVPTSIAITSCNNSDKNSGSSSSGVVVDKNGIIQPLTKNDITPTEYNFDNSLNPTDSLNVNSIEEANQLLEQKWNSLSEQQKLDCIKNDIQNWMNWNNLYTSANTTLSSVSSDNLNINYDDICINFTDPIINYPNFKIDDNNPNLEYRDFVVRNLIDINLNNDGTYNLIFSKYNVLQYLLNTDSNISSQFKMNQVHTISNINISYKLMKRNNIIFSSLIVIPTSNSTISAQCESFSNWIINEQTPITNSYKEYCENNIVGQTMNDSYNEYTTIPSPFLNMIFTINNN